MDPTSLIRPLIEITMRVGNHIKTQQSALHTSDISSKGKADLVTVVDQTVEKILGETLQTLLPGSGFISEEQILQQGKKEFTWIIDPIDGTTNFVHGIPAYSISIALQEADQTILGLVYDVSHNECFYAVKGSGAFLNGNAIRASIRKPLENCLIGVGFNASGGKYLEENLACIAYLLHKTRGIRRMGSAALDLAYVASGRLDAFYQPGLKPWDIAAGDLIVQEAGGITSDFRGASVSFEDGNILASNAFIQKDMLDLLKSYSIQ